MRSLEETVPCAGAPSSPSLTRGWVNDTMQIRAGNEPHAEAVLRVRGGGSGHPAYQQPGELRQRGVGAPHLTARSGGQHAASGEGGAASQGRAAGGGAPGGHPPSCFIIRDKQWSSFPNCNNIRQC
jgi:hypothetical protein